ncbi:conserved unknown protein [Ectocarpus siliculosus]|uniref:Ankyrin repeat protein n=1 Tax=Ectocarpus siliculosus TaxID=2880 RepID=D7FWU0_ECTSI|nr:conserved unknown protein [Ectocarpus siliculosus]|eukprot:CBJ32178.1 conserved unknown protein [Ectocarpus siliculosus]
MEKTMLNPLTSNKTVVNHLMEYVDHNQYLFFATVCRGWSRAWGERPAVTRAATNGTSVSQLSFSFHCGLRRTKGICETAAKLGRLDLLQCAVLNGCPIGKMVCAEAALRGHLGIIWWARTYGSEWDESTCSAAASGRHLKILQYCREHGCPWDAGTTASAARCGSLGVLKWARENGCEWDEDTSTSAAFGGHLDILMWCREQGCGWSEATTAVAASRGHWGVLQFCLENGCPRDPDSIEKETGQETDGVAEGCPPPDAEMSPAGPEPIRQDFTTAQSSSLEMHDLTPDELERARKDCAFHAVIYGDDAPPLEIEEALRRLDPLCSDEDY